MKLKAMLKRIFARATLKDRVELLLADAMQDLQQANWAVIGAKESLHAAEASRDFCLNRVDRLNSELAGLHDEDVQSGFKAECQKGIAYSVPQP